MADTPTVTFGADASQSNTGSQIVGPQLGVSGGQNTYRGHIGSGIPEVMPDNSFAITLGSLFKERVEAAKTAQVYQGYADARQGKTLEEIDKAQPWYTQIFGKTNYELGATAYTADKATSDLAQSAMENMPELAQKSPEEMGKWLNDQGQKLQQPGNQLYNAVIQNSLLQKAGPLMDTYTKANYAYNQGLMAQRQTDAAVSAAGLLTSSLKANYKLGQEHPDQPVDNSTVQESLRTFASTLDRVQGQGNESYKSFMTSTMSSLTNNGQWHAANALLSSPQFKGLAVEDQDALTKMLDTNYNKWLVKQTDSPYTLEASKILYENRSGYVSANETAARMRELNDRWQRDSGAPRPYFSEKDISDEMVARGMIAYREQEKYQDKLDAQAEKAATAAEKEQAEAQQNAYYAQAAQSGKLGEALMTKDRDQPLAQRAVYTAQADAIQKGNPAPFINMLALNYTNPRRSYIDEPTKQQFSQWIATAGGTAWTPAFENAYGTWSAMFHHQFTGATDAHGPGLAAAYFGKDVSQQMLQYERLKQSNFKQEVAYDLSFGPSATATTNNLSLKQAKELADNLAGRMSGSSVQSFEANHPVAGKFAPDALAKMSDAYLNPQSRAMLASYLQPYIGYYAKVAGFMTQDQLLASAQRDFKTDGGELMGKYIIKPNPQSPEPMARMLGMDQTVFEGHFQSAMDKLLSANGVKLNNNSTIQVIRVPDDKDGPRVVAYATDEDGKHTEVYLTGKEVHDKIWAEDRANQAVQHAKDMKAYETQQARSAQQAALDKQFSKPNNSPLHNTKPTGAPKYTPLNRQQALPYQPIPKWDNFKLN